MATYFCYVIKEVISKLTCAFWRLGIFCTSMCTSEYISGYVSEYTKYVNEYTSEYISEYTSECTNEYVTHGSFSCRFVPCKRPDLGIDGRPDQYRLSHIAHPSGPRLQISSVAVNRCVGHATTPGHTQSSTNERAIEKESDNLIHNF